MRQKLQTRQTAADRTIMVFGNALNDGHSAILPKKTIGLLSSNLGFIIHMACLRSENYRELNEEAWEPGSL